MCVHVYFFFYIHRYVCVRARMTSLIRFLPIAVGSLPVLGPAHSTFTS